MRFAPLFSFGLLLTLLLGGPSTAPLLTASAQLLAQAGGGRPEGAFATGGGPQYIVVRNFRITEVEATGKPDEYALTLLALTTSGEPDQRVVGGILFEIDGKSTLIPFEQGGVGDVVVKAQPDAEFIVVRAVDSNVTQRVALPGQRRWMWWGGPVVILLIFLAVRRRRQRQQA